MRHRFLVTHTISISRIRDEKKLIKLRHKAIKTQRRPVMPRTALARVSQVTHITDYNHRATYPYTLSPPIECLWDDASTSVFHMIRCDSNFTWSDHNISAPFLFLTQPDLTSPYTRFLRWLVMIYD